MAKRINALKCPQCGSGNVEEIRTDFYRCKNCSSEFFIDSDDINVNHYIYDKTPTPPAADPKKILLGVVIAFSFIVLFVILGIGKKKYAEARQEETWIDGNAFFMETPTSGPVYIAAGKRSKHLSPANTKSGDPVFLGFYDVATKKELKIVELPIKADRIDIRFAVLSNGATYFVVNEKTMFQVDKQAKQAIEFSPEVYKNIDGLASGIAKIELPYELYQDYFRITNNAGLEVYYWAAAHKSYIGSDAFFDAKRYSWSDQDSIIPITRFKLFDADGETINSKKLLVKYTQQTKAGYPAADVYMDWMSKSFYGDERRDASDTPIDTFQNEYLAIRNGYRKSAHVLTAQNFTPGRFYFDARLLAFTDTHILLAFKTSPADDERYKLQLLDASAGKIVWTYAVDDNEKMYYPMTGLITANGVFVDFSREAAYFDQNGKLVSEFSAR